MSTKISVVMSVYNGSDFLDQSIQAVLNQTFQDFEFIIIDDYSTDNSWEILKKYSEKESRIRLFRNEKNIGIVGFIKNLNFGCTEANGKYIARIDQDDICRKDRFQLQYDFLENNPEIFIVGSAMTKVNKTGNPLGEMRAPAYNDEIRKLMPKKISLYHPAIMFRKSFYKDFYREKMCYCEDYDFYLRIMTDNLKMSNIDEPLVEYRILENSMSRKQDKVIKNLFINKAKEFYFERIEKSKDSYDLFNPEEFLSIHETSSKKLTQSAINVSKKYYDYSGFEKMMIKYSKSFPRDFFYFKNFVILSIGKSFFNQYVKIWNKINRQA